MRIFISSCLLFFTITLSSQVDEHQNEITDSLFIAEVENKPGSDKVLHAEPLYIDLIRDLGARKGEKEWNIGLGLTDNNVYDKYAALVEYEWAPVNRLGLEVEIPVTFYYTPAGSSSAPGSRINSLKFAAQYSWYVSEKRKTSLAAGYIHEFGLTEFRNYRRDRLFTENVFNPFLVGAKRWGNNFHTLIYTGPIVAQPVHHNDRHVTWAFNSNIHYMIPGTRNFIGLEFNKSLHRNDFDMTIRPQMRVGLAHNVLIGIMTGIPIDRENERFSTFLRLIYEPSHKKLSS